MMDWTDRHCRFFHRLLTRHALLYTEMVTAEAVIHGKRERLLGFSAEEHPVALQLGGADPSRLAEAASIGADYGYDEINLNVGCPSDRVQSGRFGACLMAEPDLVARAVEAMSASLPAGVEVTVKCRIGIDDQDAEEDLERFIATVKAAGCRRFIVHARKAWLSGLSPKENREVPPLDYARVHRLKDQHRDLTIVLNGGLADMAAAAAHLQDSGHGKDVDGKAVDGKGADGKAVDDVATTPLDGVMFGRAAYRNPYLLAEVDRSFFGDDGPVATRAEVLARLIPYAKRHLNRGGRLNNITRHILGLYAGQPHARAFRRCLSERACREGAGVEVLLDALAIAEGTGLTRQSA